MAHPIDEIALRYTQLADELQNVERQLKNFAALQQQKEKIEADLAYLREQMGEKHDAPANEGQVDRG